MRFGIRSLSRTGQTVAAMIILGASTISPANARGLHGERLDNPVSDAPFGNDYDGFIAGASPAPERIPAPIYDPLMRYTAAYDVDQRLIAAIIWKESKWDSRAIGDSGRSVGLMQLHESGMGHGLTAAERMDPNRNLEIGIRGFRSYLERFGSVEAALAAFNAGPNAFNEKGGDWRYVAGDYVRAVLSRAAYYREAGLLRDSSAEAVVLLPPITPQSLADSFYVPALSADWRPVSAPVKNVSTATADPVSTDSSNPFPGRTEAYNSVRDMFNARIEPVP